MNNPGAQLQLQVYCLFLHPGSLHVPVSPSVVADVGEGDGSGVGDAVGGTDGPIVGPSVGAGGVPVGAGAGGVGVGDSFSAIA